MLPNLNSNLVVLILKIPNVDHIEHFRLIALANYQFKIIKKKLTDRLSLVDPKFISLNQQGFIKEKKIFDCVCTTSEAINMLKKRVFGGKIALKIDIMKALIPWIGLLF